MPHLDTYVLPRLFSPSDLRGATAVVIDTLRATTTCVTALASGATRLIACGEIDEARRLAALRTPRPLLGGERGGVRIDGFDLGNSPAEYSPERVAGREIVFTTTNGTRAMLACSEADEVRLAALVNRAAIVERLRTARRVAIVCAGTEGELSREDLLTAGAIAARLCELDPAWRGNDATLVAVELWESLGVDRLSPAADRKAPLAQSLAIGQGGRNLLALGMGSDLALAARLDAVAIAPPLEYDASGVVCCQRSPA